MIDVKSASREIGRLTVLKFFPSADSDRTEIVSLVCRMANTNEQVEWLVKRTIQLWNEWEGPRELRAVFCSRFRPADGIEGYSRIERFEDGIPADPDLMQLSAPPQFSITGEVDKDGRSYKPMDVFDFIREAAENARGRRAPTKPVTQAEIDAIKAEQDRNRKESKPDAS